jgi:large subunit ribosomal protein L16
VAVVKPGRVLFELEGISREMAEKAMALAAAKMPVRTKFVAREDHVGGAAEGGSPHAS